MKNNVILLLSIIFLLISCQRKKLTEINVEVPLPSNDAKANIIGDPNDVAAAEGNSCTVKPAKRKVLAVC